MELRWSPPGDAIPVIPPEEAPWPGYPVWPLAAGRQRAVRALGITAVAHASIALIALGTIGLLRGSDPSLARSAAADELFELDVVIRFGALVITVLAAWWLVAWSRRVGAAIVAARASLGRTVTVHQALLDDRIDDDGRGPATEWRGVPFPTSTGVRPLRRWVIAATVLVVVAVVLELGGGLLWIGGPTGELARAGLVPTAIGGWLVTAAALIGIALVPDLERRELLALRAAGSLDWPVPDEPRIVPRLLILGFLALGLSVPAATFSLDDSPVCIADGWRCGTLEIPARHDVTDPRQPSMEVAWAIRPATGASQGTFVVAVGGPGIASLSGAERWMDNLDPRIANTHDVLFFDARGTGESSPADCPRATDAYVEVQEGPTTAAEFARACRAEAGVDDAALGRYTTREVAGDLESIRRRLGIDRWVLYGESYGTSVVQEYAARYPEHSSALIIDGPIDRRLPPAEFWADAARGFDEVLERTYDACDADRICRTSLDDPRDALKRLETRLSRTTPVWDVDDGSGRTRPVRITTSLVEDVIWDSLYDTTGRMLFLRALAADAHGDHWPIEHLAILGAGESSFADDSSSFVYYAALCGDSRTALVPDDTGRRYVEEAKRLGLNELATLDIYLTPLPCLTWPSQPASWQAPPDPADIPTLVISATADPITRETEARPLAQRLPNARLIETLGGSHVMFGRGDPCVDDPVVQLVLHGELPSASRTCAGWVMDDFVAPTASAGRDFETPLDAVTALDRELVNAPEYAYWDGSYALRIPCRVSGSIDVTAESDGDHVRLDDCAWASLYAFDGRGTIELATGEVRLELDHDRGSVTYRRGSDDATSLEGTWDGSAIRLSAEP